MFTQILISLCFVYKIIDYEKVEYYALNYFYDIEDLLNCVI